MARLLAWGATGLSRWRLRKPNWRTARSFPPRVIVCIRRTWRRSTLAARSFSSLRPATTSTAAPALYDDSTFQCQSFWVFVKLTVIRNFQFVIDKWRRCRDGRWRRRVMEWTRRCAANSAAVWTNSKLTWPASASATDVSWDQFSNFVSEWLGLISCRVAKRKTGVWIWRSGGSTPRKKCRTILRRSFLVSRNRRSRFCGGSSLAGR